MLAVVSTVAFAVPVAPKQTMTKAYYAEKDRNCASSRWESRAAVSMGDCRS